MGAVIGSILPLAVGIAISPIPIVAAILMLLSPRAKGTSIGFLAGWIVGISLATTVFTLLSAALPERDEDASRPVTAVVQLVLGLGLLVVALRQWRGRPADGEEPDLPKWMGAIDTMTAVRGLGLGVLLSAVNPKNLLLAAGGGVEIGGAGLDVGAVVVCVVVFTALAASTVAVPVVGYLVASAAMTEPLGRLREWLVQHNASIMAVLLLVLGVVLIGKGVANF
ncbi:membrane protein [Agromyces rhizosphaerae]|uniref:Membrane protein n=1 Tax=Agromyces rhizosphaerae TaxID=88374 RepID=A0A9W6FPF3_9MICO|nr:GAP family protein [Agromyces rhizosphaerae]GLI27405.1 membrane protein [Agromyces rhizosphaerae]